MGGSGRPQDEVVVDAVQTESRNDSSVKIK
jgi:hypothetical protein